MFVCYEENPLRRDTLMTRLNITSPKLKMKLLKYLKVFSVVFLCVKAFSLKYNSVCFFHFCILIILMRKYLHLLREAEI